MGPTPRLGGSRNGILYGCRCLLDKLSKLCKLSNMAVQRTNLGSFLRSGRERKSLTLRAVERATGVSNAYLSQLESGKILQPSPLVLHKLAELYEVPYVLMLEQAGYPATGVDSPGGAPMIVDSRLGSMDHDEETALKEYLDFLRSRKGRKEGT